MSYEARASRGLIPVVVASLGFYFLLLILSVEA